MSTGFDAVGQGVTITLGPDADGAFAITLERGGAKVHGQEGPALLDDPKALGLVIDGMLADLMAAEHQKD